MKNKIRNIFYYLGIPLVSISFLVFSISFFLCDFEKSVDITSTLVQTIAIFVAWLWAYNKFGWEKRAENALKAKAMLIEYHNYHNLLASRYRVAEFDKKPEKDRYLDYTREILWYRNEIVKEIHCLIFLDKSLRERIFNALWLTIWNEHWEKREKLNENWNKFEKEIVEIKKELDNIVSN